ncbi:MAG: hypothetical protein Ta2A_04800 [Treponemataceae bacterium]|nr:MAG: hypothetical protein Ta2A_04800 [Treponemataceae bacterium]
MDNNNFDGSNGGGGDNGNSNDLWDFNQTENQAKNRKNGINRPGVFIFVLMFAAAILVAVLSAVEKKTGFLKSPSSPNYVPEKSSNSDYIAVMHITGVITDSGKNYNQQWLLDTVEWLKDDPKNQAIFLNIDSPGGGVYESDGAYLALKDYAESKPVYAYFGQLAASGGYYIGCAASYIYANRNTLTGSIGVISAQSIDLTGLMEKYGVKVTTITAGKNKNMMNYNSPMTEEQRSIMQSVADECYDQFVDIVATARGMDNATVRTLADGRIYTAKQALAAGLIDKISAYDEALDNALEKIRTDKNMQSHDTLDIEDFRYTPKYSFIDHLTRSYSAANSKPTAEVTSALNAAAFPVPLPAYYYAH